MARTALHPAPTHGRHAHRPMWEGSIAFGLVNIPVKLFSGVRKKELQFHLLHDKDHARLQEKYVCSEEDKEVARDEMVKGYEVRKNTYVTLEPRELEALAPKASRTIELLYFVDSKEIDPLYFERPYFLLPGENAGKAYTLLARALEDSGKGAVTQFVMHNREYVAHIRAVEGLLVLDTMRFPDEIVQPAEMRHELSRQPVNERELRAAGELIESLTSHFEPQKLHNAYHDAVLDLIHKKAEGEPLPAAPEPEEEGPQVIDLMAALQKSLTNVKKQHQRRTA